jgi:methylmalonyl-CoA mutase N-terminal domain/subunit
MAKVDALGGAERAIAAGFFQEEIARSAYEFQLRVESGDTVIVGVNKFGDAQEPPIIPSPDYSALERGQVAAVRALRARRDAIAVERALAALGDGAATFVAEDGAARAQLMPLVIDAVRARATVGEISDTLGARWGTYRPTT